ncbi:MAG: hypothetical protein ACYTCV_12655 [Planctomycetota bacterium]|jgi:hypothetical protein
MKLKETPVSFFLLLTVIVISSGCQAQQTAETPEPVIKKWTEIDENGKAVEFMTIDGVMVHEKDPAKQPPPEKITPGTSSCGEQVGTAPSDAIVLFDGTARWSRLKRPLITRPIRSLVHANCTLNGLLLLR